MIVTDERLHLPLSGKRAGNLVLAALLATTFAAHASGLGDIGVKSHLGERLRVEIQLRGGDASPRGAECFHLSNALADNSGLPRLRHASLSVLQNPPRLAIASRDAIFEPAIELAIFYGCGVYLSRSYTVLLSPRETAAIAPPLAAPVGERQSASPTVEPRPRPVAERRVRVLQAGETPEEMAQRLYPRSEAYRNRFLRELLALNPGRLAADELDQPQPEGATLKIPPRFVPPVKKPASAEAPAAAVPATPPATSAPASPPAETTAPPVADRLVLTPPDEAPAPAQATPEQARLEMDQRLRDVIGQARALSNELSAMQAEFPNPPPEIRTRLLEMETRLARMELVAVRIKLSTAATDPAAPAAPEPAPPAEPPAPPLPAVAQPAQPAPVAAAEEDGHGFWWGLGILLALAAALAAYLARNTLRRGDGNPLDILMPGRGTAVPAAENAVPATAAETPKKTASTISQDDLDRPGPPPEFERAMPGEIEIVEVAHVLAIFGRTPAAIDVLTEFIGQNPDKALNPSLYLLKLYKQTDRPEEFAALAARLHTNFNVLKVSWEDPIEEIAPIEPSARDYREIARELEKIPHVYSRISEQWGSRQCLDYLNELLRDNREGQRQGLPLAATNEVLNLIAILQREIPAETSAGKA